MNNKGLGLLFLNPFASSFYSLYRIRDKEYQHCLYLWFLIFGAAFCAANEMADSFHWVEEFEVQSKFTFKQYLDYLHEYFTNDESYIKDIYSVTVNFLVGLFSSNYHWSYLIYAAVFGCFYIKVLQYYISFSRELPNALFYCILFFICMSNPIFNINGMRFWTAAWIGVFAVLKVLMEKQYRYVILLLITPLIHNAFYIWIVMSIIALIFGRFQKFWSLLFVISSFFTAVSTLDFMTGISDMLPPFFQSQIYNYMESDYAIQRMAGTYGGELPLYAKILKALPNYLMLIMGYILILNRKTITRDQLSNNLFSVYIVLATIANFIAPITAMVRFQFLIVPFLAILWALNYNTLRAYNWIIYSIPFVYAYSLLYLVRNIISVTELWLYICPAPITLVHYLFT